MENLNITNLVLDHLKEHPRVLDCGPCDIIATQHDKKGIAADRKTLDGLGRFGWGT